MCTAAGALTGPSSAGIPGQLKQTRQMVFFGARAEAPAPAAARLFSPAVGGEPGQQHPHVADHVRLGSRGWPMLTVRAR